MISTENQKENQEKLKKMVVFETVFSCIKDIGGTLALFAPPGVGAGIVLGATIVEKLVVDKSKMQEYEETHLMDIDNLSDDAKSRINNLCKGFDSQFKCISDAVNRITEDISNSTIDENSKSSKIFKSLKDMVSKVQENVDPGIIKEAITSLKEFLADKSCPLPQNTVDDVKSYMETAEMPIAIYSTLTNGVLDLRDRINSVKDQIKLLDMQSEALKQQELEVYSVMYPMFQSVQSFVNGDKFKGQSHVMLDMAKWQTQNNLENVKRIIGNMVKAYSDVVKDKYKDCFDKLIEGIRLMIDINDRIDTYQEQCNLATYIADLSSVLDTINMHDTELREAMIISEERLITSTVIEQYEIAKTAFNEHHFPFASIFSKDLCLDLPDIDNWKNHNNTDAIISAASFNIEKMILSKETWAHSYNKYHNQLAYVDTMSLNQSPLDFLFSKWSVYIVKDVFRSLCYGKRVTLSSDNAHGIPNAVKFKEIGLKFNFHNDAVREKFYEVIPNFFVSMIMGDTHEFKCGEHICKFENSVNTEFLFIINRNGTQRIMNESYRFIKEKTDEYILSPHTEWKVEFIAPEGSDKENYFLKLEEFINEDVDIELVGVGQYLKNGPLTDEICKTVDEFYDCRKWEE